jgi:hypothetical protein
MSPLVKRCRYSHAVEPGCNRFLAASEDRRLFSAPADAAANEAHHRARAMVAQRRIVQLDPVPLAVELSAPGAAPKSRRDALLGNAATNAAMAAARNVSPPLSTAAFHELNIQHRMTKIHVAESKNLARHPYRASPPGLLTGIQLVVSLSQRMMMTARSSIPRWGTRLKS